MQIERTKATSGTRGAIVANPRPYVQTRLELSQGGATPLEERKRSGEVRPLGPTDIPIESVTHGEGEDRPRRGGSKAIEDPALGANERVAADALLDAVGEKLIVGI